MSFLGGSINNQTLNGIESITDGYITIQDGTISNLQALSIGGDTTVASNLYVGGRITCAYTASLNTDIPNKLYVDLGLSSLNTSQFLKLSGGTMIGGIIMANNYITGLPAPINPSDAINKTYADNNDDLRLKLDGSTPMTGSLNMGGKIITGIPYPTITSTSSDAVNKDYVDINDALRLFKSGDTMTGSLNMTGNTILNLSTTTIATSAVNKGQMDTADNLRLKLDGTTPMTGALNMNSYTINNVPILQAGTTLSLNILTATIMQIQAAQVIMNMPISVSSTIGLGNVGIDMNSTKITNVYSLTSYANNNLIFNYLSGIYVLPKITLTSTTTKITDGLLINSGGIDMSSNSITNIVNISSPTATNLTLLIGTTTSVQLTSSESLFKIPISISSTIGLGNLGINMNSTKITNVYSLTSYANNNLIFNYLSGINVLPKITLTSTKTQVTDGLLINSGGIDISGGELNMASNNITNTANIHSNGTNPIYLNNNNVAKVKIDAFGLTMQNSGTIDMASNSLINTSNIHSNLTNPIYINNNNVAKVKVDASGITMQNSGNINLLGNNILNVNYIDSNGTTPLYFANSGVSICQVDSSGFVMSSQKNININGNYIQNMPSSVYSSDAVNQYEISASLIPLVAWRSGETMHRKWLAPVFGNSITTGVSPNSNAVLTTTTMTCTTGNHIHVTLSCQVNANGSGDDKFRVVAEFQTQTMSFNNVLPTVSGWRERNYNFRAIFIPTSTGSITIQWRLYNDSTTSDTVYIDNTNWEFSIEEIQA